MRKLIGSLPFALLVLGFFSSAQAHENRVVNDGTYNLTVGWRSEPALLKDSNAFDFYATLNQPANNYPTLDTEQGDIVDITVKALYLAYEGYNAPILAQTTLTGDLLTDHETSAPWVRYNKWFKPTQTGAYGFRVQGTIQKVGYPAQTIDERFVCGGGTLTPGDAFVCVKAVQSFPW